jgi:hypothetical protein
MTLRRHQRGWLSRWLIAALLFTQLATASYACPMAQGNMAGVAVMADMPGCDGNMPAAMDPAQPQLCQAHCQQGSQTVNQTLLPDMPAASLLLAVLDWACVNRVPTEPAGQPLGIAAGASPPGAPPLYLTLLVLRN